VREAAPFAGVLRPKEYVGCLVLILVSDAGGVKQARPPGAFQVWGKMWHNAVILVLDGGRGGEENEKDAGGDESSVVGRS